MSERPTILVTNDDGYDSPLLKILVDVMHLHFEVYVAAPKSEQSWIGKAISCRRSVSVREDINAKAKTWILDGTPSDCVNIALGNLLEGVKIDAVVSGINIGFNVSLPIVMSSGTVGGALEGALMGYPAVAFSQLLGPKEFQGLQHDRSRISGELEQTVRASSTKAVEFVQRAIQTGREGNGVLVHNINFPMGVNEETPVSVCELSKNRGSSQFASDGLDSESYSFCYRDGENIDPVAKTDLNCLRQGHITYSLLNFSQLS